MISLFGNVNSENWHRKIASGGHPIPDFVEIVFQILLKILHRLIVHALSPSVCLDPLIGIPYNFLADKKGFRVIPTVCLNSRFLNL